MLSSRRTGCSLTLKIPDVPLEDLDSHEIRPRLSAKSRQSPASDDLRGDRFHVEASCSPPPSRRLSPRDRGDKDPHTRADHQARLRAGVAPPTSAALQGWSPKLIADWGRLGERAAALYAATSTSTYAPSAAKSGQPLLTPPPRRDHRASTSRSAAATSSPTTRCRTSPGPQRARRSPRAEHSGPPAPPDG